MSMTLDPSLEGMLDDSIGLVPNFPESGVLFRDITPLLADGDVFKKLTKKVSDHYRGKIDFVAGLESRGFILAAPMAYELGIGMLTVRKQGKLPPPVLAQEYTLEYGSATLEIRPETVPDGARVLIVDDVLATGGTAAAARDLLVRAGAEVVGLVVLLELVELGGRKQLADLPVEVLSRVSED